MPTPWFGLEKSLCFASPISWSILHPQVWLSSLLYKQASPLMGKRHLRRVQNISVFLFEEVPRVAASHGYDHNSIWPVGIVPLIPILIIKDPSDQGPSSSNQCLLVYLNNMQFYLSSTISSLSPLPLNSFPPSLANLSSSICNFRYCWSLTFLQQTKLLPMKPYLLFAFLAGRKSDPFIFPKIFTNSLTHPCHKYSPQNLHSSVLLPKHWTLQEFWHSY